MIRTRNPRIDDREMIRLIRTELIPMSHTARPLDAHMIRELPNRFRKGVTYVAAESKQSKPVAFVHVEVWGSELFIDMLVTHPEYRGMKYGTELMLRAEAYGRSHQCLSARLYVDSVNVRALRFYAKLGYQRTRYIAQFKCYELIKSFYTANSAIAAAIVITAAKAASPIG